MEVTSFAIAGSCALVSFTIGYLLGRWRSRAALSSRAPDDLCNYGGSVRPNEELKMVLVARTDLKMGSGKTAAQCCHAALGAANRAQKHAPALLRAWSSKGQAKVVLKAASEQELLDLQERAEAENLITYLVADAGRTQIAAGSLTVLALGPAPISRVDAVTGHLKLL